MSQIQSISLQKCLLLQEALPHILATTVKFFMDNPLYSMLNDKLAAVFAGRVSNIESAVVRVEISFVIEGREDCIHFSMAHCGSRLMVIDVYM